MQLKKSASSGLKKIYNKASQNYSAKLSGSNSLLYNKFVLYASFIICFINLLMWMFSGKFVSVAIFLLAGYLTSFFSKNMIVILVISFVVSNVVHSGSNIVLEGMESKENEKDAIFHPKNKKEGMETKEDDEENQKKEGLEKKEYEESEGLDNSDEDEKDKKDKKETPCMADGDCEKGYKCSDKYVCVSAK